MQKNYAEIAMKQRNKAKERLEAIPSGQAVVLCLTAYRRFGDPGIPFF